MKTNLKRGAHAPSRVSDRASRLEQCAPTRVETGAVAHQAVDEASTAAREARALPKSKLPNGWRLVKLGEICEQDRQIVEPNSERAAKLPYLSLEHVESQSGKILKQPNEAVQDEGKSTTFAFDSRHVLYGKLRPYLNKVALPGFAGRCTTEIIPLLPRDGVDREFLCWLLRRSETVDAAMQEKTGSRMPRADMNELMKLKISLPTPAEQKRIAGILKEQMTAVERARASAEAQLQAARHLPAAYLRTVFNSPVAQGWERKRIDSLGDASRGDTVQTGPFGAQLHSTEFTREGVPVVNIGNVQWGFLDLSKLDHVSPAKAETLQRYKVREGDLLFTRSGTVGRCAIVPRKVDGWLISYHLLRVALDSTKCDSDFIAAAIRGCGEVQAQVRLAAGRGATRDGVNSSILSALIVPVPPLADQRHIAAQLSSQMASAERLRQTLTEQLATINHLPAALLRRAFNGEL